MKKLTLLLALLLFTFFMQAQQPQLWGLALNGGANSTGTVFDCNADGSNFTVSYNYASDINARSPEFSVLCQASNGLLYGMTPQGANGPGVLYSYNPSTGVYTNLFNFSLSGTNGSQPNGSLIQASNGLLYGMTYEGGTNNDGVLFSYNISTGAYSNLYNFSGTADGANPEGSLVQASNGLLYGMTQWGGMNNKGVLFSYNTSTNTYTNVFNFNGTNGEGPYGSLMQASNGLLYGMAAGGGSNVAGVLFSYNTSTNTYTNVFNFNGTNGESPNGSLMQASNGLLYGMTTLGGTNDDGVLFSFNPSTHAYADLLNFNGTNGEVPFGSLMQAANGLLYGMTALGGANNEGVMFSYNPSTSAYTNLLNFIGTSNGGHPDGTLMQAGNGLLYGVTLEGGTNDEGVLFSYNTSTSAYTNLLNFIGNATGANPFGSLMQAGNGLLYGMTEYGGIDDEGVLFSYNPTTNAYTNLLNFNGTNGENPWGSLMQASNGLLYGMTPYGGTNYDGVLFSYNPSTNAYTDLLDFNGTNGKRPYGGLVQASNGLLYGMTGWASGNLFSYNPSTGSYTVLLNFSGTNGAYPGEGPYGSLMQASNGLLYGMTYMGGTLNDGVLFSYNPSTSAYTDLLNFSGTANGEYPQGNLMQASNGLLYGMTPKGGSHGDGVLFSYNPSTNAYTNLLNFSGTANGANLTGSLMQAGNGLLYGMTNDGGTNNDGVLFSYNPSTSVYTNLFNFNTANGTDPAGGNLIELGTIWTAGAATTDWFTAGNWSNGIPSATLNAFIPAASTTNNISPLITGAPGTTASVGSLFLNSGATLTESNGVNLDVYGNFSNGGTITMGGGDHVQLMGSIGQTFYGTNSFSNLEIDNAAGITIDPSSSVSVSGVLTLASGTLTTNGNLTLTSNSVTGIGVIDNFYNGNSGSTISGNIIAQRYYAAASGGLANYQHFIGSPVNDPAVSQLDASGTAGYIIPTTGADACDQLQSASNSPYGNLFSYNEAAAGTSTCSLAGWDVITSGNIANGVGYSYLVQGTGTLSLTGSPNISGDITLSNLTNHGWSNTTYQGNTVTGGWWLVANPYPDYLTPSSNGTGMDGQVQVWIENGSDAGTYQSEMAGSDALLAPFQAYMVHVTNPGNNTATEVDPTTGSVTINAGDRTITQTTTFYRSANQSELKITALNTGTGLTDNTTVAFNPDATVNFDTQMDANKLGGATGRHTIYSVEADGQYMSINTLPSLTTSTVEVPATFKPGVSGNYTFSFAGLTSFEPSTTIMLQDKLTNTMYNVQNGEYKFTANATDNWDRFNLIFTPIAATTGLTSVADNGDNIPVWSYQNKVNVDFSQLTDVKATVTIYDILGQQITSDNYEGNNIYTRTLDNIDAAFMIVKVVNRDQTVTEKVFITNAK